ncbi:MAG: hypothetical protein CMK92_05105 [Pseudomonas sp.]|nr:hypothetical protein [Pseudomonas sp.]
MGGTTSSTAKNEVLQKAVSKILAKAVLDCNTGLINIQELSIEGDGNIIDGVSMKQVYNLSMSCFQDVKTLTKLQNKIKAEVKAAADAQSAALIGALNSTKSDVNNRIESEINNLVSIENITRISSDVMQKQTIAVKGNRNQVYNINFDQTVELALQSAQQVVSETSIINDIDGVSSGTATATTTTPVVGEVLSAFGGLFDGLFGGDLFTWIIIIIVIAATIYAGYWWYSTQPSKSPQYPQQQQQYQQRPQPQYWPQQQPYQRTVQTGYYGR